VKKLELSVVKSRKMICLIREVILSEKFKTFTEISSLRKTQFTAPVKVSESIR
jgi:hypothetical protein